MFVPRQSSRRRHVERPDEARLFGEGMKTGYGSTKSGEVLDTWKRCHDSHEPHVSVAVEEKGTSSMVQTPVTGTQDASHQPERQQRHSLEEVTTTP